MKVISNGKVYDVGYGGYERICRMSVSTRQTFDARGEILETSLCRLKSDGSFFALTVLGGREYERSSVSVNPMTRETAAYVAERYLDYDEYLKFFGDPRGRVEELEEDK